MMMDSTDSSNQPYSGSVYAKDLTFTTVAVPSMSRSKRPLELLPSEFKVHDISGEIREASARLMAREIERPQPAISSQASEIRELPHRRQLEIIMARAYMVLRDEWMDALPEVIFKRLSQAPGYTMSAGCDVGGGRRVKPRRPPSKGWRKTAYDKLVAEGGPECWTCGSRPGVVLDHDHLNSRIRGLLCWYCNHGVSFCMHVSDCPFQIYMDDAPALPLNLTYRINPKPQQLQDSIFLIENIPELGDLRRYVSGDQLVYPERSWGHSATRG